jgi:hypothetical protein
MSAKKSWYYKLSLAAVVFGLVAISSVLMTGQPAPQERVGAPDEATGQTTPVLINGQVISPQRVGMPDDWSHHHLIFSDPGTAAEALAQGRFEQWYKIVNDPRYILQKRKRNRPSPPPPPRLSPPENEGVWTMNSGPSGTIATVSGTFSAAPTNGTTLTITGNGNTLVVTAATAGTGTCAGSAPSYTGSFTIGASATTAATALAALLNAAGCGSNLYVNASSAAAKLTINATISGSLGNDITVLTSAAGFDIAAWDTLTPLAGGTSAVGPAQFPAKYSFYPTTANCASTAPPDFVVFPTGNAGSATQANVIAYDNLYTGCSGTVPSVYWSYNTGGDTFATSPVLSLDGTQVALVDSTGHLVLVKWSNSGGTLATPTTPTLATSAANYRTCTAPCYYSLLLSGETADTTSDPFVDYTHDTLYVGGGAGKLHQVTTVFTGTPTETTTTWPVTVTTGATGTPVYDVVSGYVYIGPSSPLGGGIFKEILASTGALTPSATLATPGSFEIPAAPVVDSTAGKVYVFVNDSSATVGGDAAVYQLATGFASGSAGTQELLGQGSLTGIAYTGAFDNTYLNSSNGASPTGNLYACGRASASQTPTLYQIPINLGVIGTPVAGPALANGVADCSPLTEFYNGTSDDIFLSVEAHNLTTAPISCPTGHGCLMSFNVTQPFTFNTSFATSHTAVETGGTSGIIIDNKVTSPETGAQIYFTPLVTAMTCAGTATTGKSATTTLNGAITAAATSITVASGANTKTGGYILVGTELMLVTAGGGTVNLTVIRGVLGTTAAAASNGALVTFEDGCATQLSQAGLS